MNTNRLILEIDGAAGTGKSTLINLIEKNLFNDPEARRMFKGYTIEVYEKQNGKVKNTAKFWKVQEDKVLVDERQIIGEGSEIGRLVETKTYEGK